MTITSARELCDWLQERLIDISEEIEQNEWPPELSEALFDLEYMVLKVKRITERA